VDIVELLVSRGANISAESDQSNMTAFDQAVVFASSGSTAMLELFLANGWANLTADKLDTLKYTLALAGTVPRGSRLESQVNALAPTDDDSNRKCPNGRNTPFTFPWPFRSWLYGKEMPSFFVPFPLSYQ
jgi:hypothetical protein